MIGPFVSSLRFVRRLIWIWLLAAVVSGPAFGTDPVERFAGRMQSGDPIELTLSGQDGSGIAVA